MSTKPTLRARPLCMLLFLCIAVDMAVRSFAGEGMPPAQRAIPAAMLDAAVGCGLLMFPLRAQRRGMEAAFSGNTLFSKLILLLLTMLLSAAGAATVIRAEAFFRYGCKEPMPQLLVYAIFLCCALYALHCGAESLVRVAGIAAGLFGAAMVLLFVSNLGGMRLFNLSFEPFDGPAVLQTAALGFTLPPELLLLFVLCPRAERAEPVPVFQTIAMLCLFYIALSFCAQAVLGEAAESQVQTIHTLSRLGSLSVFRRFDALHTAVWMLAELCKLSAFACGVQATTARLLPQKLRQYASRYAIGAIAIAVVVCAGLVRSRLQAAFTIGTAFLLMAISGCSFVREGSHGQKKH